MKQYDTNIEIYKDKRSDGHWIKKIHFSFPITYDGEAGAVFIRSNDNQDDVGGVLTEQPDVRRSSTYWAVMKKDLYQKEQTNCLQIVSS